MSRVETSIDIERPISMVYNQWTQFEDFPAFMEGVDEVEQLNDRTLRWQVSASGVDRSFVAEIIEQEPDRRISWRSQDGEDHTGAVTFEALDDARTRVHVVMSYRPADWVEQVADSLNVIERRVGSDLERFKQLIESSELETGSWRGRIERREVTATDTAPDVPTRR